MGFNTVTNKKIAVLGFAFKKDTGDVRETPAISVCHMLMQDGAKVHVYDPKVKKEDALTEFKYHSLEVDENRLIFEKSAHEALVSRCTPSARVVVPMGACASLPRREPLPERLQYHTVIVAGAICRRTPARAPCLQRRQSVAPASGDID